MRKNPLKKSLGLGTAGLALVGTIYSGIGAYNIMAEENQLPFSKIERFNDLNKILTSELDLTPEKLLNYNELIEHYRKLANERDDINSSIEGFSELRDKYNKNSLDLMGFMALLPSLGFIGLFTGYHELRDIFRTRRRKSKNLEGDSQ